MKEKKENQNPSIKILVGYHKPAELLKDDILTPIHLGRALATEASKDGNISKDDYKWMCENMIGDDTGDNISYLNRCLNELTGIYWAWKNYDKLGNPDYIGFMHYRRHFIFDNNFTNSLQLNGDGYSYIININKQYFEYIGFEKYINLIKQYDVILPKLFNCNQVIEKPHTFTTCKDFLCLWNGNQLSAYKLFIFIITHLDRYKMYSSLVNEIDQNTVYYPYNMFIMKKDIFFKYCNFLFEVVFLLNDILGYDVSKRDVWTRRELAWVSEYISTLFFYTVKHKYETDIGMINFNNVFKVNNKTNDSENFYSAVKVVQNHLSYKIGKAIINAKTFKLKFLLPLTLLKIIKHHRLEYQIYSCLIELNPGLKR
ncbi:DUF4422 domain-containing protein, partial [Campylobacter jejuni]|nr:DUF4422 domain-containing protein [Campylobacter jejuni]